MEYILVLESSYVEFLKEVRERIKEGFKPIGGACVFTENDEHGNTTYTFTQALIKE